MPSKKLPIKPALQALVNCGLTAKEIQSVASRIAAMSSEEIEMQLFNRAVRRPEPPAEASSDLVAMVARLRTASKRRTNAEVLSLLADELEEDGRIKDARHLQYGGRETVAQWLSRVGKIVPEDQIEETLERLLKAYSSGARIRRVK